MVDGVDEDCPCPTERERPSGGGKSSPATHGAARSPAAPGPKPTAANAEPSRGKSAASRR
jgi:hypothetical protein